MHICIYAYVCISIAPTPMLPNQPYLNQGRNDMNATLGTNTNHLWLHAGAFTKLLTLENLEVEWYINIWMFPKMVGLPQQTHGFSY